MYSVLHNFSGGNGGTYSTARLAIDQAGNLYGTTRYGGNFGGFCGELQGCGTVFELQRVGSARVFRLLYKFNGPNGALPAGPVTLGADGSLIGTTLSGGVTGPVCSYGCGLVYRLVPPQGVCSSTSCPWNQNVLYRFRAAGDGAFPVGNLSFDNAGNIFGVTDYGLPCSFGDCGGIYELSPSNGEWTESLLYAFTGGSDGYGLYSGVALDNAGNVYDTTFSGLGQASSGTIFELTHTRLGWTLNTLYAFSDGADGEFPAGGVIFDQHGNLYGSTTSGGGSDGSGTVFELIKDGGWALNLLYTFAGPSCRCGGPFDSLTTDAAGNLYGTTVTDGAYGYGSVFKLTAASGWTYTSLHAFTGGSDGSYPQGTIILDAQGNLYGTTSEGGAEGAGVVFQITP